MSTNRPPNIKWPRVVEHARRLVEGFDTKVTLRQLFYRLVADGTLPNLRARYSSLSDRTAEARRQGTFPDLLDRKSGIEEPLSFDGPEDALAWLKLIYRRDRTEGQPWTILLGVEKDALSAQLEVWFSEPLGLPRVALGGYGSQTVVDEARDYIEARDRPAVLIYAGDFDPTGVDIDRDFVQRVGRFDKVVRVALNEDQLDGLPANFDHPAVKAKLERDSRAPAFKARHGALVQYEVDALAPEQLRALFQAAIDEYHDEAALDAVLAQEDEDREAL